MQVVAGLVERLGMRQEFIEEYAAHLEHMRRVLIETWQH